MYIASACLCGLNCRYDWKNNLNQEVIDLFKAWEIIPVCPEQLAGFSTPRIPIEKFWNKIVDKNWNDVTEKLLSWITESMKLVDNLVIQKAFLKSKSPSCWFWKIYDGTFSWNLVDWNGLFADKLLEKNIEIISCN